VTSSFSLADGSLFILFFYHHPSVVNLSTIAGSAEVSFARGVPRRRRRSAALHYLTFSFYGADIFCGECTRFRKGLPEMGYSTASKRVCYTCFGLPVTETIINVFLHCPESSLSSLCSPLSALCPLLPPPLPLSLCSICSATQLILSMIVSGGCQEEEGCSALSPVLNLCKNSRRKEQIVTFFFVILFLHE